MAERRRKAAPQAVPPSVPAVVLLHDERISVKVMEELSLPYLMLREFSLEQAAGCRRNGSLSHRYR
jgi:hypothetical protein